MTDLVPSWSPVSLSDSPAVKFAGNWNADAPTGFHNVSYPEMPASVAYTFYGGFPFIHSAVGVASLISLLDMGFCSGTQARAVGFMIFNDSPLYGWIAQGPEGPFELIMEPPSYNQCDDDPVFNSEPCPPAFYITEILPCNRYTLNLTVMHDQVMQIKEFDFIPCTSDDDQASSTVSTTALTSGSSPSSAVAAEKQQKTLGTDMIVGAVLGAMAFLALSSLAFFILLRRSHRRSHHHRGSKASPPPPSSSPFLISFLRSRPWLRLSGPQPKISTSSAQFLTAPVSLSSPAAASGDGSGGGTGGKTGHWRSTTLLDAPVAHSGSPSSSAAPATTGLAAPILPWLFDPSVEYYPRDGQQHARDGEWGGMVEKQPLRHDDTDLDSGGLAVAHGYLPESKELMALEEREQSGVPPSTTEALPLYQTRDSLQWSS